MCTLDIVQGRLASATGAAVSGSALSGVPIRARFLALATWIRLPPPAMPGFSSKFGPCRVGDASQLGILAVIQKMPGGQQFQSANPPGLHQSAPAHGAYPCTDASGLFCFPTVDPEGRRLLCVSAYFSRGFPCAAAYGAGRIPGSRGLARPGTRGQRGEGAHENVI